MSKQLHTAYDYAQWARRLVDFSPVAETAKGVCIIRGVDPYQFTQGMEWWRAVAMEALLLGAIAREEPKP